MPSSASTKHQARRIRNTTPENLSTEDQIVRRRLHLETAPSPPLAIRKKFIHKGEDLTPSEIAHPPPFLRSQETKPRKSSSSQEKPSFLQTLFGTPKPPASSHRKRKSHASSSSALSKEKTHRSHKRKPPPESSLFLAQLKKLDDTRLSPPTPKKPRHLSTHGKERARSPDRLPFISEKNSNVTLPPPSTPKSFGRQDHQLHQLSFSTISSVETFPSQPTLPQLANITTVFTQAPNIPPLSPPQTPNQPHQPIPLLADLALTAEEPAPSSFNFDEEYSSSEEEFDPDRSATETQSQLRTQRLQDFLAPEAPAPSTSSQLTVAAYLVSAPPPPQSDSSSDEDANNIFG
jgi:hypothetical protein